MVRKAGKHGCRGLLILLALCVGGIWLGNIYFKQNPQKWLDVQLMYYQADDYDARKVDAEMAKRIGAAQAAAKKAGHKLEVVTAYRPWFTQLDWYRQGLAKRGTTAEARRNVLPPWESMHVRGLAVDFKEGAATTWLRKSNGRYGLCLRYANEPWHYEMRAPGQPCPPIEPDASAGNR